ncbi:MAG: Rieske 2Fe-2S domain-containing protein [Lapillicoccus sp.]
MSLSAVLSRLVERSTSLVEHATALDAPAEALEAVASRIPVGPMKDLLSGVAVGHPLHPALVTLPIGAFSSAVALDLTGREQSAARTLVGLGLLSSVPTALAGLADWSDTSGAERRVGLAHLALNVAGLGVIAASWLSRRNDPGRGVFDTHGPWLTLTGFGIVGASSWLGGHLSYAMGVGVDTTAFQRLPTRWTDAVAEDDLVEGQPVVATVGSTPILVVRTGGRIHALADRCTHRGGPLHEGTVQDGCIQCPWHASRFALSDGAVVRGPATRPAPVFETRVVGGRVQVRRNEVRTLRLNPAG